ncbi:OmpA family protein [Neptunomonas sp.]|uniref:OmpA family protein n=1 Tax=Neptunomonas sp. TaxID=1971898 RepID=UPI0035622A82
MNVKNLFGMLFLLVFVAGCAERPSIKWQQSKPLCVVAGALAGGAVAGAADNKAALGVLLGAGVAYFACDAGSVCEGGEVQTSHGCESDSDRDGVYDSSDDCPNSIMGARVNSVGCVDEDEDGVLDRSDACLMTPANTIVDQTGCPVVAKISLEGVNFGYKSSELTHDSKSILDVAVEKLNNTDVNFVIEGHTDSIASRAYNLDLSLQRAQSVLNYLLAAGVASERMTAIGYGETQPIASNQTDEGRARNRRVAFNLNE